MTNHPYQGEESHESGIAFRLGQDPEHLTRNGLRDHPL